MSPKTLSFVLLLLTAPLCLAQEFEKNGLPCVAEICLGDGIAELSKVQWDRAKNPFDKSEKPNYTATRKVSEREMKFLQSNFRGDLAQAAPFLYDKMFDSGALSSLPRVTAACEKNELIGTYTTQSGNPTRVGIALTPSQADTSKQRWTVVSIVRTFPAAVSNEQKTQVEAQLAERYHAFGANNRKIKNPKPGEGRFYFIHGSPFGFNLLLFRGIEEVNRLKLHPACGGTAKVKID
jgi:hypothetical protein